MKEIEFEYRDAYSHGGWSRQSCIVKDISECKRIYGLGVDCEYRILSVKGYERGRLQQRYGVSTEKDSGCA
ncbi:MAG: hypothetical protein IIY21_18335 [Clostridiales bacterium]|nr:hypothetical protein [Clostridiales bacterium]